MHEFSYQLLDVARLVLYQDHLEDFIVVCTQLFRSDSSRLIEKSLLKFSKQLALSYDDFIGLALELVKVSNQQLLKDRQDELLKEQVYVWP